MASVLQQAVPFPVSSHQGSHEPASPTAWRGQPACVQRPPQLLCLTVWNPKDLHMAAPGGVQERQEGAALQGVLWGTNI